MSDSNCSLLLAVRRSELGGALWEEIDLDAGLWTIPACRTKGNVIHLVPLPALAVALLRTIPRCAGCAYVLTTTQRGPAVDWDRAVRRASTASRVTGWTCHDLRRTARTGFSRLGVSADAAERVLGHSLGPIRRHYDFHDHLDAKRDALARWAAHVVGVVA